MNPRILALSLALMLTLSGCFKAAITSLGSVESVEGAILATAAKTMTENKAVYAYDPTSNSGSVLAAPSGSLSGASVTIAARSLAIPADLIFEEAVPLVETSLSSSLQIDSSVSVVPVGSGLIIRPSVELELGGPLQISMPLSSGTSLQGLKYFAVLYKQYRGGVLRDGLVPNKDLNFTDDNKVTFEGFFGSYWVVALNAPLEDRAPVESSEPIVNFQKVSVVETSGITAESAITVKAAIPPLAWKATRILYTDTNRTVTVEAETVGQAAVSQCKADLFSDLDNGNGITVDSGAKLQLALVISKKEAHELFGRFRCFDEQGRLTISPWSSAAAIPALIDAIIYGSADFYVWKPQVQSRELLKLVLSTRIFEDKSAFTVFNSTSNSSLFDSIAPTTNPFAQRQTLTDGRELLKFKLSSGGKLQGFNYDANHLQLRRSDGQVQVVSAFTVRDFTIFYPSVMASFSSSKQQASDGFQGWTSVLNNPIAKDKESGSTQLTHGMPNIINP